MVGNAMNMNAFYLLVDGYLPRRLQTKLSLLVTALLIFHISLIGALFSDFSEELLREQISKRALDVAHAVAENPLTRAGIMARDTDSIQRFTEDLRSKTEAAYIVVGDHEEVRLSHPDPEKIGLHFVGGDLGPALRDGKEYSSEAVGTLGPSMRGIVPVYDWGNEIIGFVAVGYLASRINELIHQKKLEILGYIAIVLVLGVFGSTLIARGLKAAIMGLEIHEIGALFHERNAIIGAIREGIIAVDGQGQLTYVNQAARSYIGERFEGKLRGRALADICPGSDLVKAIEAGLKVLDAEMIMAGKVMLVNVLPLEKTAEGSVASFRPKDELDRLTRELSHMQEYSELLRAQTHEYSNKMHTIAGLLQLGAHQEALDLVVNEASGYQELVRNLAEAVPDPVIAGLILGKYNRACELKIELEFDPENSFSDLPATLDREPLVTILGNLLDNAFDAVREKGPSGLVRLFLTDLGSDLVMEVEDSGTGISAGVADRLFETGITTKNGNGRGTGLALVKRAVDSLEGQITFAEGELGGALFTVIIPKRTGQ